MVTTVGSGDEGEEGSGSEEEEEELQDRSEEVLKKEKENLEKERKMIQGNTEMMEEVLTNVIYYFMNRHLFSVCRRKRNCWLKLLRKLSR